MRCVLIGLVSWLFVTPAFALSPSINVLNPQATPANRSAGIPAVDDNLTAAGYPITGGICAEWGHRVPCNNHYSTTRASTKYVNTSDGIYVSVPSNVFALGYSTGGLIEESRTNDALWSRDMTNAAWVKVTMTTALNAVGIDGAVNSATTITASGANATILETITLGSQADNYSVFLKRVTGSGTINLCLAATACGTATPCTVTSTTTFTRCSVTATVLNPIVGIQIVTNGDAVIADFNQMEPGGFPTSPILTTSSTATRAGDNVKLAGLALSTMQGTSLATVINTGAIPTGTTSGILEGNTDNVLRLANNTTINSVFGATGLTATLGSGSYATGLVKTAIGVAPSARSLVANNGTVTTDTHSISANASFGVGGFNGTIDMCDCYIQRMTFYASKPSDTTLKTLTQ